MNPAFSHAPVMRDEVVALFEPVPSGVVVDGTVGGGGHAEALLTAHPHLTILGIDRDDVALAAASERLAPFGARARLVHARSDELRRLAADLPVVGVLLDLGVSSPQFDVADRGFSYRLDAPLDMRMDRRQDRTASAIVNTASERELARLLSENGERFATRIARAIVAARPLATTGELAEVVRGAIPAPARRRGGHPAKRTFQAIRIEVNDELDVLRRTLAESLDVLVPRGRCVVLAYHSGEDRIVKEAFVTAATGGCTCPPALPCACGAVPTVQLLGRSARKPSAEEIARNPRAESARLRAVEKLAPNVATEGEM